MEITRRFKLIQTFWLFWAFQHRGIHNSVLGPTILDIELEIPEGLRALSYLFLASGFGSMLGSLAAGFLTRKFDLRLQLFLSLLVGSLSVAMFPQVHHIIYMYTMVFVFGVTRGLVVCYVMQIAGELWETKGPPFHFIACGTSAGAVIAPLISRPFLFQSCNSKESLLSVNRTDSNVTTDPYPDACQETDTRVDLAYLSLGVYILPAVLAHFYYWLWHRKYTSNNNTVDSHKVLNCDEELELNSKTILFFIFLFLMYVLLSSLPATYVAVLTIFGVNGPLHMTKGDGVTMTCVFYLGSFLGRLLNGQLSRRFPISAVNVCHLVGLGVAATAFRIFGDSSPLFFWIITFIIGYFSSPYLGGVMAWVTDVLYHHPQITSLCFLSSGTGNMVFPFLGTWLFEKYGPDSYLYLILTISLFMILTYACLWRISKVLPSQDKYTEIESTK